MVQSWDGKQLSAEVVSKNQCPVNKKEIYVGLYKTHRYKYIYFFLGIIRIKICKNTLFQDRGSYIIYTKRFSQFVLLPLY